MEPGPVAAGKGAPIGVSAAVGGSTGVSRNGVVVEIRHIGEFGPSRDG